VDASVIHRLGTRILSVAMLVLGLALIVQSLAHGGPAWVRLVIGLLFVAAGVGRLYVLRPRGET